MDGEVRASQKSFVFALIVLIIFGCSMFLMVSRPLRMMSADIKANSSISVTSVPKPTRRPLPTPSIIINKGERVVWELKMVDPQVDVGYPGPGGSPQPFFDKMEMRFEFLVRPGQVDAFWESVRK